MTQTWNWVPVGLDQDLPSAARVYDYLLGGAHNFAVDRQLGDRLAAALPQARELARLNRAFLRRAVLQMLESGVRQFLDVGSGIPTVGNVHEVAQRADPEARVVYVDIDPVAVAHSKLMLDGNDRAAAVQADLYAPAGILRHNEARRILDFDQPIGLLMLGVLHFVPEERDPNGLLARYHEALAPGSQLALSHFTADSRPAEVAAMVEVVKNTREAVYPRSRQRIVELFDGFELIEPGVVSVAEWLPDAQSDPIGRSECDQILAGVGRKR